MVRDPLAVSSMRTSIPSWLKYPNEAAVSNVRRCTPERSAIRTFGFAPRSVQEPNSMQSNNKQSGLI
jgi:hypothetical protein